MNLREDLLKKCPPCSVVLTRLQTSEINQWRKRTTVQQTSRRRKRVNSSGSSDFCRLLRPKRKLVSNETIGEVFDSSIISHMLDDSTSSTEFDYCDNNYSKSNVSNINCSIGSDIGIKDLSNQGNLLPREQTEFKITLPPDLHFKNTEILSNIDSKCLSGTPDPVVPAVIEPAAVDPVNKDGSDDNVPAWKYKRKEPSSPRLPESLINSNDTEDLILNIKEFPLKLNCQVESSDANKKTPPNKVNHLIREVRILSPRLEEIDDPHVRKWQLKTAAAAAAAASVANTSVLNNNNITTTSSEESQFEPASTSLKEVTSKKAIFKLIRHPLKKPHKIRRKLEPKSKTLDCNVCSRVFESTAELAEHIYTHTASELQQRFVLAQKESEQKETQETFEPEEDRVLIDDQKDDIIVTQQLDESSKKLDSPVQLPFLDPTRAVPAAEPPVLPPASSLSAAPISETSICACHNVYSSPERRVQIEMVLFCEICRICYRRGECFETHYRINPKCNEDSGGRSRRLVKLFCTKCQIVFDDLSIMRQHIEEHASIESDKAISVVCNICKVVFYSIGTIFNNHWHNHVRDPMFIASRYSFQKSVVQKQGELPTDATLHDKYIFIAEFLCSTCETSFISESLLENHKKNGCQNLTTETPTLIISIDNELAAPSGVDNSGELPQASSDNSKSTTHKNVVMPNFNVKNNNKYLLQKILTAKNSEQSLPPKNFNYNSKNKNPVGVSVVVDSAGNRNVISVSTSCPKITKTNDSAINKNSLVTQTSSISKDQPTNCDKNVQLYASNQKQPDSSPGFINIAKNYNNASDYTINNYKIRICNKDTTNSSLLDNKNIGETIVTKVMDTKIDNFLLFNNISKPNNSEENISTEATTSASTSSYDSGEDISDKTNDFLKPKKFLRVKNFSELKAVKNFICQHCKAAFENATSLNEHLIGHTSNLTKNLKGQIPTMRAALLLPMSSSSSVPAGVSTKNNLPKSVIINSSGLKTYSAAKNQPPLLSAISGTQKSSNPPSNSATTQQSFLCPVCLSFKCQKQEDLTEHISTVHCNNQRNINFTKSNDIVVPTIISPSAFASLENNNIANAAVPPRRISLQPSSSPSVAPLAPPNLVPLTSSSLIATGNPGEKQRIFSCKFCKFGTFDKNQIIQHVIQHNVSSASAATTSTTSSTATNTANVGNPPAVEAASVPSSAQLTTVIANGLTNAIVSSGNNPSVNQSLATQATTTTSHNCPVCMSFQSNSLDELNNHMRITHYACLQGNGLLLCLQCPFLQGFMGPKALKNHKDTYHFHYCQFCKKQFQLYNSYKNHTCVLNLV